MAVEGRQKWPVGKRAWILAAFVATCVGVLIWTVHRETEEQKEIKRLLAEMRASGEPLDAQDMARLYPDPSTDDDAEVLFARAFFIATNSPAPSMTPLVMSGALHRTQAIDARVLEQLVRYRAASSAITNVLPAMVPEQARFGLHWSEGMTNRGWINLVRIRNLIQLIATHVLTAAETGDAEAATSMIEHGFTLARTLNYDGMLVMHMIRHACDGLMCSVTERALSRVTFTDEQLQRIAGSLRTEGPNALRHALGAEHCYGIWAFQSVRDGMPIESLLGQPAKEPWWKRIWNKVAQPRRKYSDADFLAYLQGVPARLLLGTKSPIEAMNDADAMVQKYQRKAVSKIGEGMVLSNMKRMIAVHAELQAGVTLLATTLAMERARLARTNEMPLSLESLVPKYLPSVPGDPFDGKPLRFKKLERGYVIYSIGSDNTDQGGLEKNSLTGTTNYDVTLTIER